VNLKNIF